VSRKVPEIGTTPDRLAMVDVTERTLGLWFVEYAAGNFLLIASRTEDGAGELVCRFLSHQGSGAGKRDVKDWFQVKPRTPDETIPLARETAQKIARETGGKQWELLRGSGSIEAFVDELVNLPFMRSMPLRGNSGK